MNPVPLIHCTDLYHFPADPDDHWDLATAYALALRGNVDLKAVIFDYCQDSSRKAMIWVGDPAIQAVAQMNHITGLSVPCAVGTSRNLAAIDDKQEDASRSDRAASSLILRILEESPVPVAISIVGSCKDVALAANRNHDLFRRKCRGIYAVAGTATTDPAKGANKDTNVILDPLAYSALFHIGCPIYWTPCLEDMDGPDWYKRLGVGRNSSYWKFKQGEVLPRLSKRAANFFLFALTFEKGISWYRYLDREIDPEAMQKISDQDRNMWSTAPLLHLAGLMVISDGSIIDLEKSGDIAIFGYTPVSVETNETGVESWTMNSRSGNHFIFQTLHLDGYQSAMTKALGDLLSIL